MPMATNVKQAEKLVEAAEKKCLHLTVGFLMRFIPGLQLYSGGGCEKGTGCSCM